MTSLKLSLTVLLALGCLACSQPSPEPTPIAINPSPSSGGALTGAQQPDVQLPKDTYFPGEQIDPVVLATGLSETAWVGVIPADIPHGKEAVNDEHDLNYKRTSATPLYLIAPKEPGDYDVRLNSDDAEGDELASRSFKVVAREQELEPGVAVASETVAPGKTLKVTFTAPDLPRDAWIGIVPSAIPHGDEDKNDRNNLGYQHLEGRTQGWMEFTVPSQPGTFDMRLHDMDRQGKELASVTFKVVATP